VHTAVLYDNMKGREQQDDVGVDGRKNSDCYASWISRIMGCEVV